MQEGEKRREVDIERSSPRRAKTRRHSAAKDTGNIVSEWNGGKWRPAREEDARPVVVAREREVPARRRVVPGGPRPVETAQRLKARGIILL